MAAILKRLEYDGDLELTRIVRLFQTGKAPVFYAGMDRHFEIAKYKPASFTEHGKVLAISIGGTNLKLMIASMQHGRMVVHHVRSMNIPDRPIGFDDFFDDLILNDETVHRYMRDTPIPEVGVSFPMAVIGNVAYHPTKVPMLNGVIARDFERDAPTHNFRKNFADYLARRNLPSAALFFQGDGIVAHHGVISLSDIKPDEKSTLIICGTGMATGDEENYVQMGIMNLLDYDEELYPADQTENYQFHYAIAGKGIFGLMERAIRLKAKEPDSQLGEYDLSSYFTSSVDTKTVADIWKIRTGAEPVGNAARIRALVSPEAFGELEAIASAIMERTARSIANSLVGTIVKMKPAENGKGHKLFYEGSICVDNVMLPKVKKHIEQIVRNKALFDELGEIQPFMPDMDTSFNEAVPANGSINVKSVDVTLIGSASMIMAHTS